MEKVVRGEKLLEKIKVDVTTPIKAPDTPMMPPFGLPPLSGGSPGAGSPGRTEDGAKAGSP